MFELSVLKKYLIPSKKQLSASLIAAISIFVISIVVWLVLLFLSITEGLEKRWIEKLTTLNAPVKITPTRDYYNSYYYLVDSISSESHYNHKTLSEKLKAKFSDPYNPKVDASIPYFWPKKEFTPQGNPLDPVKTAYQILQKLSEKRPDVQFGDFEVTGALLRLQLIRSPDASLTLRGNERQHLITHVSLVASLPQHNPYFKEVVLPLSNEELNHQLFLASLAPSLSEEPQLNIEASSANFQRHVHTFFQNVQVTKLRTSPLWRVPLSLLPTYFEVDSSVLLRNGRVTEVYLGSISKNTQLTTGKLIRSKDSLYFKTSSEKLPLEAKTPIFSTETISLQAQAVPSTLANPQTLADIQFQVSGAASHLPLTGTVSLEGLSIQETAIKTENAPSWIYFQQKKPILPKEEDSYGVLLPKSFKDNGALIGDKGYLSYSMATLNGIQEQRIPVFIAGFYDPGFMAAGMKCLFVDKSVVSLINASNSTLSIDRSESNGLQVFFSNPKLAPQIKQEIQEAFQQAGIAKYWRVQSYLDYDFAKDFLTQFQSDKYLFSLIALLILLVACSNIISFLVILVNNKKKEIGVLRALGASSKSISVIFGLCGMVIGFISCFIGTTAAYFTLKNIDKVIGALSFLQGQDLFNAAFYGSHLPNTLSHNALIFILITTPIISLTAGLIPAIKASLLNPVDTLRGDS